LDEVNLRYKKLEERYKKLHAYVQKELKEIKQFDTTEQYEKKMKVFVWTHNEKYNNILMEKLDLQERNE